MKRRNDRERKTKECAGCTENIRCDRADHDTEGGRECPPCVGQKRPAGTESGIKRKSLPKAVGASGRHSVDFAYSKVHHIIIVPLNAREVNKNDGTRGFHVGLVMDINKSTTIQVNI